MEKANKVDLANKIGLVKITDLASQLGLSSRSLRYYEQIGLINSTRPEFEKYRFYNAENINRLKQIIVLRKMQIPIKDIIRIYESNDMSTVVEVFVDRIREIDNEVNALSELKRVTADFLQTMIKNGITKISAIPLLYEEMDKQLELLDRRKSITYGEFDGISGKLLRPAQPSIISLPAMRVISSYLKENPQTSDADGFWRWVQSKGLSPGRPGQHEQFDFQTESGDVIILRVPDDFTNDDEYLEYRLDGGLFASVNVYLDEDLGERFRSLVSGFDSNKFYEIDYIHDGNLRCPTMLENLISPDEKRELVALLVPVKKRLPDYTLFDKPEEIAPDSISIEEIETQNPVFWEVDVPMDKLIPINHPYYKVTERGEAEYIGWISTRVLSTSIAAKLPFRVDIEFLLGEDSGGYGHGDNEGSIRLYHGEDLTYMYAVNMENNPDERLSQQAICFNQPIFGDYFKYPKRGNINDDVY